VTAYSVTRPEDQDRTNGVVVEVLSKAELLAENERLHALVAETRLARDAWHDAWKTAVERRIADRQRLTACMRLLAAMQVDEPELVERARREIWRLDE
jgi:hypothetical protein